MSNLPTLDLTGVSGNAFALLAAARRVALRNNMDWDAISKEAKSGDYDHLLATLMSHFDVVVDSDPFDDDDDYDDEDYQ